MEKQRSKIEVLVEEAEGGLILGRGKMKMLAQIWSTQSKQ